MKAEVVSGLTQEERERERAKGGSTVNTNATKNLLKWCHRLPLEQAVGVQLRLESALKGWGGYRVEGGE